MKKEQIHFPLFWKFTLALVLVVTVFGSLNFIFINGALLDLSNTEINRHGHSIAKSISERSIDPILFDDISYLDKMVSDYKKIDQGLAYILIFDKNEKLIAHSFENAISSEILNLNKALNSDKISIERIVDQNDETDVIRNFNVPIFNKTLGNVAVGIYENNFTTSIKSINNFFLSMVVLFLVLGIIGAFVFSLIITLPIKRISRISENLNLKSIKNSTKESNKRNNLFDFIKLKEKLKIRDEIDVLNSRFRKMVIRLQNTYDELQYTQASLFQSEKMASLGALSAGIAHEINNPIAGMQNCLKRLEKNPNNLEQNKLYIDLMQDAVDKIENVVQGLLKFSRKNEFIIEEIDLAEKIENVLFLSAYQLERSRIAVIKKYKNKSYLINASSNHIEQVLLNLVLNSIDAINEKKEVSQDYSGEIVFEILENSNRIDFSLEDNGIGISKDHLNLIFDPFFTDKKIKQGTGLGLSVCYSIIEQHNGKISAALNNKNGLTIKVSIPKKINHG
jgi:two-component system NtrC family sensor kinase